MSARIGNPQLISVAQAAVNGSAGRAIPLNNNGWVTLISMRLLFTATATVGNRVPAFTAGAVATAAQPVWVGIQSGAALTANAAQQFIFGASLPSGAISTQTTIPLPDAMALPPLSQVVFLDTGNIDANDSVSGVIIVSY